MHSEEVQFVMARTTISIPDPLAARLEPLKDHINVSEICQRALEARVQTYERIAALSEEDVMEKLVQRLKIQKQESTQWSTKQGAEDGQHWAISDATYAEIVKWSDRGMLDNPYIDDLPLPDSAHDEESYNDLRELADDCGEVLDDQAYARGFLEAVGEVWLQVENKV